MPTVKAEGAALFRRTVRMNSGTAHQPSFCAPAYVISCHDHHATLNDDPLSDEPSEALPLALQFSVGGVEILLAEQVAAFDFRA
jgi:hypothetical protein